jgi:hypothetical protein
MISQTRTSALPGRIEKFLVERRNFLMDDKAQFKTFLIIDEP